MDKLKIGKFIAKCRKEKNLTQEQLAEKLNISKNAVSKWERGICLMDLSLLKPLSEILDISVIDILSGEKVDEKNIKEKAEENLISLSEFNHYKSITNGTVFIVAVTSLIIFCSLIKGKDCFGYTSILFGFSAIVYYNKYKQSNQKAMFLYFLFMTFSFIVNIIAFIISLW